MTFIEQIRGCMSERNAGNTVAEVRFQCAID